MKKLEDRNKEINETTSALDKKIAEDKVALQDILSEMNQCEAQFLDKLSGIQKSAEKYIADINREVQSYENNIVGIGKKIEDLSDAISELQQ